MRFVEAARMTPELLPLHFLRPDWLWALLALPPLAWFALRRARRDEPWRSAVDAHLLPHLLDVPAGRRRRAGLAVAALGYALAVLALAGPAWRQVEQPLAQGGTPLVIALDLSSETLAADLPPSRLAQARAKIARLLQARESAPVALVAYADDAFTVAPLTEDAANVALFVDALAPDVMPVDGRRTDRAIEWSAELLRRAGHTRGDILLLTGDAEASARDAAAAAARAGYRVSVLGLGTPEGAQVLARDGAIRPVRLEADALRALARAGDGGYAALRADEGDLRALGVLDAAPDTRRGTTGTAGRSWKDEGYWLLPPLMLLALFAFRRRTGLAAVLLCVCLPWSDAHARTPMASGWWQRPDQAAHERLVDGNEAYRRGDFEAAAALYRGLDNADAHYNRGNALAKAGEYERAIDAYDEALERQPGMPDALANRRAVAAAMQRQPPSGPKDDPQGRDGDAGDEGKPGQAGETGREAPPRPDPPPDESSKSQRKPPASPPKSDAGERERQQRADAAQRERMQRALQQQGRQQPPQRPPEERPDETPAQRERRIANEAWLRRVPDDPGGLLRAKFRLEHERRRQQGESR